MISDIFGISSVLNINGFLATFVFVISFLKNCFCKKSFKMELNLII